MAVTFDSRFEKSFPDGGDTSPVSFTSNAGDVTGSVGNNSNRVLIGFLCATTATELTSPAMTWNGTAMTLIGSVILGTSIGQIHMFGLIAPATGAQTLAASWTGTAHGVSIGAISVYDADQTTGWQNAGSDGPTTGTAVSCAVTSANGNMAIACVVDENASSATITAGTSDWDERDLSGNYNAGHLASTGGTTTLTWTLGTSVSWIARKVDVIAAGGGGGPAPTTGSVTLTGNSSPMNYTMTPRTA